MTGRGARIATSVAMVALGAVGLAMPSSVLVGGVAWLVFLVLALSGLGWLVARATRIEDPDVGLRATWGAAAYLAIAGLLLMFGICSRPAILCVLTVGTAGFTWRELTTPLPFAQHLRTAVAYARSQPLITYIVVLVGAAVAVQVIGAVVHLDRNPWDDDIAYTPFVKRLLDAGDLVEPFSFRRLASYGGQTALQALVGARGTLASVHALDQGIAYALTVLVLIGHARSWRTSSFWVALVVIVVVMLPDTSINTASYWTGAAMFYALYRAITAEHWPIAALLGAATCTLRASYIPVVVLFVGLSLLFALRTAARSTSWREAWRAHRGRWMQIAAIALVILVPYWIAAFVSSRTFLFPIMKGTWNHALSFGPPGATWVDELSLMVTTLVDSKPIVGVVLIAPLIAFTRDARPSRPLAALFIANAVGFLLLVHGFTDADSETLWRYAFGCGLPLFLIFAIEAGGEGTDAKVQLPSVGRWMLVAIVLLQVATNRTTQVKAFAAIGRDFREAASIDGNGDPNARVEAQHYARMQQSVPPGAKLLVMVDDAAFLDFARNPIANLDVPGFASPHAQLPSFAGAEALRSYLLGEGYRFIAFVRPDASRYAFRRGFWIWRIFNDAPFFQAMSAYAIDIIDSLGELATSSVVIYDADGLVVLDIDRPHEPVPAHDIAHESERREQFLANLAGRENLVHEWLLTTRHDLAFSDGFSGLTFAQPADDAHWFDYTVRDPNPTKGTPIRWMYRRAHLRLRGTADMHLRLRGHMNVALLYTRPRLDVSLDGQLLTSVQVDAAGAFTIDLTFSKAQLSRWRDLYIVFNAIGQPEQDLHELRQARLEEVLWQPR